VDIFLKLQFEVESQGNLYLSFGGGVGDDDG
jgi:hypothetical protein